MRLAVLVGALLCTSILANAALTGTYTASKWLNPKYKLSWRVDSPSQTIFLGFEVETTGWIGFGIGEQTSGSMPGADIVTATVVGTTVTAHDRHATTYDRPTPDSCEHWTVIGGSEADGKTTVELSRKIDTGDVVEDRAFFGGPMRIIYAWGDSDDFKYHDDNRATGSVTFWGTPEPELESLGGRIREFRQKPYTIPSDKKTYMCASFDLSQDYAQPMHITALEPIIDNRTLPYVHHIVYHSCKSASTFFTTYLNSPGPCGSPVGNAQTDCMELFYAWAIGGKKLILPEEAGVRVGPGGVQRIVMQFHFDNPDHATGKVDRSGLRWTETATLRANDAWVVTLGDPYTSASAIPILRKTVPYEFSCPASCTSSSLSGPIHAIASMLHMHEVGAQMWTSHYRGTQKLPVTNKIEYWAFDHQGMIPVNYTIMPGDRLNTHCIFDTSDITTGNAVTFGSDSSQEMCMDFVMYYPKIQSWPYCGYVSGSTVCGEEFTGSLNPGNAGKDPAGEEVIIFAGAGTPTCSANNGGTATDFKDPEPTVNPNNGGSTGGEGEVGGDWYPVTVAGVTRYFPAKKVLTHGDSKVFPAEMELYWRIIGPNIEIALRAQNNGGWIGIGFSKGGDEPMVGSSAVIGWKHLTNEALVYVGDYFLDDKASVSVQPGTNTLQLLDKAVDVADGYTQIRFIRPLNIPGVSVIDPKGGGKTPIIFAFGAYNNLPSSSSKLKQHIARNFDNDFVFALETDRNAATGRASAGSSFALAALLAATAILARRG